MSQWHQLWNHPDAATTKKAAREEIKKARSLKPVMERERGLHRHQTFYGRRRLLHGANAYSKAMEKVHQKTRTTTKQPCSMHCRSWRRIRETIRPLRMKESGGDSRDACRRTQLGVARSSYPLRMTGHSLPNWGGLRDAMCKLPHALHMPSHMLRVSACGRTTSLRTWQAGDGDDGEHHACTWVARDISFRHGLFVLRLTGHDAEAKALIDEVKAMPDTVHNMMGPTMPPRHLVYFTALYPVETRHWQDAAALTATGVARPEDDYITRMPWVQRIGNADPATQGC